MTLRRIMVETRCPGGYKCNGRHCVNGWRREDRTAISPEAIEAALEHTRQLNFWEGINDPVWDESEIRKITEAAISAFLAVQYGIEEATENTESPLPWQARHQGGRQ